MSKDWKGNSNSLHAAIAAHRGGKSMRQEDDFYATDPKALEMLLDHYSEWLSKELNRCQQWERRYIWECACGTGNLSKVLESRNYWVLSTDKVHRGYGAFGSFDFLKTDADSELQIILTNPPYSLATEFIEHALDILPDGGLYIAFMNIGYLAGQKRWQRVYQFGTLREVYVFSKRVEVWKNGEPPKDKCGSIANYAWYVFQKGYKGQPTLYWL